MKLTLQLKSISEQALLNAVINILCIRAANVVLPPTESFEKLTFVRDHFWPTRLAAIAAADVVVTTNRATATAK